MTLLAEYQYVTSDGQERTWGTTNSDTFTAQPGAFLLRIIATSGKAASQRYQSMVPNQNFVGHYIQNATNFVPIEVTLTAGENSDAARNRTAARAIAVTQGEAVHDQWVERLRQFGVLSSPMSQDEAIGG